jgi:serine/threonine-protein kinase RsbW
MSGQLLMSAQHELIIPSDLSEARRIQSLVEQVLQKWGYSEHDIFAIKLALEEALVNAIKHGNQMDPDKKVHVRFAVNDRQFEIHIADEGPGFNPDDVPDPTDPENLERPCGRGLLLMRGFMTHVEYAPPGNQVRMIKVRDSAQPSS